MIHTPVNSKILKQLMCAALVINFAFVVYIFSSPAQGYQCGIEGNVLRNHPVSAVVDKSAKPTADPCPLAVLYVRDAKTNKFVTKITTDENGYFRVHLVPGKYLIEVQTNEGNTLIDNSVPEQNVREGKLEFVTVYINAKSDENRALPGRFGGVV
jgi:hypothetical protein